MVHSSSGRTFTYGRLLNDVASAKNHLAELAAGRSLRGERVAFLAENGYDYVGMLFLEADLLLMLTYNISNSPVRACS